MKWQPIETAPKNEVIDLWSAQGWRYVDAIWDRVEYSWDGSQDRFGWTDKNSHGSIEKAGPFTHWMRRPAPPEAP